MSVTGFAGWLGTCPLLVRSRGMMDRDSGTRQRRQEGKTTLMHAMHRTSPCSVHPTRRTGFSLTELLVVIGIIVLLVGLLLVALGLVRNRALRTRTEAVMNQFANACVAFQSEHGFYPGVIPDEMIRDFPDANGNPKLSSTENAMLHLMGGFRVLGPTDDDTAATPTAIVADYIAYRSQAVASNSSIELIFGAAPNRWKIVIDTRKIGEGPTINGKPFAPYFTPGSSDVASASYPITSPPEPANPDPTPHDGNPNNRYIPDLVDAWGQPIIYIKQARNRGPLVDQVTAGVRPQFTLAGVSRYMQSTALGERSQNQNARSIFGSGTGGLSAVNRDAAWAAMLAHQSFYKSTTPVSAAARGAFVLISAGPDGFYFSRNVGPGLAAPIADANIQNIINPGPRIFEDFDDVRIYSGG